nr:bag family molecular chaperone regulator 5, mitochondrial [Quercus suber]
MRMNEALMGLLLKLDSVPGVNPMVREARRKVSPRIVALQEIIEEVLIKIPVDLTVVHLRQGDDIVAVLACVADEIQWPLVKDEAGGEDREDIG